VRNRARGEPQPDLIAESRFALARASWEGGGDRAAALGMAAAARDGYRAMPRADDRRHADEIDAWIAARRESAKPPRC
jgi:hypothetical protein